MQQSFAHFCCFQSDSRPLRSEMGFHALLCMLQTIWPLRQSMRVSRSMTFGKLERWKMQRRFMAESENEENACRKSPPCGSVDLPFELEKIQGPDRRDWNAY